MTISDELRTAIGSMLMVGVRGAQPGDARLERDLAVCEQARAGGVILFDVDLPTRDQLVRQGFSHDEAVRRATRNIITPEQTRRLIHCLHQRLGPDLTVAVDHESGVATRLSPAHGFPETLDAKSFSQLDESAKHEHARRLAKIAGDLGVDLNLAPCVDLDRGDPNHVISGRRRAFSSDPLVAARCARVVIGEHRRLGVMTCLKHFPGHGSAGADSHHELPELTNTALREEELNLYRAVIPTLDASTWVMTGHLLDRRADPALPASLSYAHTTESLRNELGFDGVVVTDSLDMRAVADRWTLEEMVAMAVNAGADVLLDGVNAPGAARQCTALRMVDAVVEALKKGKIAGGESRILTSGRRIRQSRAIARALAEKKLRMNAFEYEEK